MEPCAGGTMPAAMMMVQHETMVRNDGTATLKETVGQTRRGVRGRGLLAEGDVAQPAGVVGPRVDGHQQPAQDKHEHVPVHARTQARTRARAHTHTHKYTHFTVVNAQAHCLEPPIGLGPLLSRKGPGRAEPGCGVAGRGLMPHGGGSK
jgi:hypothetical protein